MTATETFRSTDLTSAVPAIGGSRGRETTVRRLARTRAAVLGGAALLVIALLAAVGPLVAPDPLQIDLRGKLQGPTMLHWLGTDEVGRDIFARLVVGARTSLAISISTVAIAVVVGTTCGLASGYYRGAVEVVVMRLTDVLGLVKE